jgi:hypothetical protein
VSRTAAEGHPASGAPCFVTRDTGTVPGARRLPRFFSVAPETTWLADGACGTQLEIFNGEPDGNVDRSG